MNPSDIAHLIATSVPKRGTALENVSDISKLPHEFMPPDEGRDTTQWDVFVPIEKRAEFENALNQFMQNEMGFAQIGSEEPVQPTNYRVSPQFTEDQIGDLKEIGFPLSYQIFFATKDVPAIKAKADELIARTAGAEVSAGSSEGVTAAPPARAKKA